MKNEFSLQKFLLVVDQDTLAEGKQAICSLSLGNRQIYVFVEREKWKKVLIIPPYPAHTCDF